MDSYNKAKKLYDKYKDQVVENKVDALRVVEELKKLKLNYEILTAVLLSDARILQNYSVEKLKKTFSKEIISFLKQIIKINTFSYVNYSNKNKDYARESIRLMLIALIEDARIMFVKLAYRSQRLDLLKNQKETIRKAIAEETLDIYAPLANRFGLADLKSQLEDKAFRYLQPEIYYSLAEKLQLKKEERDKCIKTFIDKLNPIMKDLGIEYQINGRSKHIYSIWKKMNKKKIELDMLHDLLAIRVYVGNTIDCYRVLGELHTNFKPLPNVFDDYIANPKTNGYQSLHTVLVHLDKVFELQIRTFAMNDVAEFGIASHWQYKENKQLDEIWKKTITLLNNAMNQTNYSEALTTIGQEISSSKLFVLTEKNEIVELPAGATPLDFAYQIHTELGHSCRSCYVDGKIRTLNYKLKNGQRVLISSIENGKPLRQWLNKSLGYLNTNRATSAVQTWFNKNDRKENIASGKLLTEELLKRYDLTKTKLPDLMRQINYQEKEKMFEDIGKGLISEEVLSKNIMKIILQINKNLYQQLNMQIKKKQILGTKNMPYILSLCCRPQPEQDIVGLVTHDRKLKVHKEDCAEISAELDEYESKVNLTWSDGNLDLHKWEFTVTSYRIVDAFKQILDVLSTNNYTIITIQANTEQDTNRWLIHLAVEASTTQPISKVLTAIENLNVVISLKLDHKKIEDNPTNFSNNIVFE